MTQEEVGRALKALEIVVSLASLIYPPLRPLKPLILALLKKVSENFSKDVAKGNIVPDGRGGWVPRTNSLVDPKTGRFL